MANYGQQLATPPVPSLPLPPNTYSALFQSQNNGVLRTFFIKLTNAVSSLLGPRGSKYLNAPYGAFQDSTDQTASDTTTAYPITFNTTDFANGVTLSNSSRLNVSDTGIYNIQFSIQLTNNSNSPQDVDIWFRKNGTNIDNSNSKFGLSARKDVADPYHLIMAMNFFVSLTKADYIELMWRTTSTDVKIEQYAAGTSPTRPATPSVIATVSFVSNLSV
jgi:hypothetical protein